MRPIARHLVPASLLALVASFALGPMAESDLFFRIEVGEEILRRGNLPARNLFSFTYPDHPDIDTSWLFEVGAAILHGRVGFPGLVVAKTVVLLAAFAGAYLVCRRRGAGPVATALALAGAALVARDRFVERPHVFSFLGEVGLLWAVDAVATRAGRGALRAAIAAIAGVILWANLHAGVFVAPILVAAAAAGAALDRDPAWRRLCGLAIAAIPAMFLTPVGFDLLRYLQLHLTLPALHPVDEFRSPSWISDPELVLYVPTLFAVVVVSGGGRWRSILPVVPLGLLALRSVRFGPDLAIAGAPLLAVGLEALASRWAARRPAAPRAFASQAAAVAAVGLLGGWALLPRLAARESWHLGLDEREVPLGAVAFVNEHGLRNRMFNDFEIGSYLLFDPAGGYPHHRVFVDPRIPAYPEEMHRLLGRPDHSRESWAAAMDHHGVESALLAYAGLNRRVAWWDPERYALVFRAEDARVFVRRLPRYRNLIAEREIPATFSFTEEEGSRTHPLEPRPVGSPVSDCEWQRRLGDLLFELDGAPSGVPSPRALAAYRKALEAPAGCLAAMEEGRVAAWLGALALGAGRGGEALDLLDRALARGNREASTLANRAVTLEALGRHAEAATAWDVVAAADPEAALAKRARERRDRLRLRGPVPPRTGR